MNVTPLVFNEVHLSLLDSLGSSNSRLSTQNSCNSSTVPSQVYRLRFQSKPKDVQRKISVDPGSILTMQAVKHSKLRSSVKSHPSSPLTVCFVHTKEEQLSCHTRLCVFSVSSQCVVFVLASCLMKCGLSRKIGS